MTNNTDTTPSKRTPLYVLHQELGAKMVPFAGYDMPVSYPAGILAEHKQTRAAAGLFDVSHMGQARIIAGTGFADAAAALETLVPGDIQGLAPLRQRYTLFTDETGGILDDLMVTNAGDHLFLVVNAACKAQDLEHLRTRLGDRCTVQELADRALLALQGPAASSVLGRFAKAAETMPFMSVEDLLIGGIACFVSRSGYTGEDGFEISVAGKEAERLARLLLAEPEVKPVGLGARDSLRLEAGLCLYGQDIDRTTTPIEAGLAWTIGKRRRAEGGFPGAEIILEQLRAGAPRRRVGIRPEDRTPARAHTEIRDEAGRRIGEVTSGSFGPSVGGPIAMGYVESGSAAEGTALRLAVRGRDLPARVAPLPFVQTHYYRG
ncbi:glycine cleavage system aminomethyltransferase GcvT [Rhodospirillaceae bacterium SYSU D60014]|uniref:glycine cleavage system aminomethyltransferase GcvT n=1 Tax=Virgifigura deserti TaxID=2268457 RepID=UPI000E66F75D